MKHLLLLLAAAVSLFGQSSITLNGTSYTLFGHPRTFFDGPSGTITTSIKDPDGAGASVAPKAVGTNPPWTSLLARSNFWNANYPYTNAANVTDYTPGQQVASFAMRWYSDNSQTAYHDAALYMLNHIEAFYPLYCNEAMTDCMYGGGTGYYVTSYGVIYWNQQWLFAYELMRGEMTTQQQIDFASKFTNDLSAFGGISGDSSTSCTNPSALAAGTVSVSGVTITATNAIFGAGNPIQIGYWIVEDGTGGSANAAQVVNITDSTHASVNSRATAWAGYSGVLGYRRNTWVAGDCGFIWVGKHGRFIPQSVTYVSGATAYPPGGGTEADYRSNNTFAPFAQLMAAYVSVIDDDANASARSGASLTILYNDWYANIFSTYVEHGYTGFHYSGSAYGISRPMDTAQVPAMFTFSINGSPPALDGVWMRGFFYHYFMNWMPSCATAEPQWGQEFGLGASFGDPDSMYHIALPYAFERTTNEGKWFNWTLRHRLSRCSAYGNAPTNAANLFFTTQNLQGASIEALDQWIYAFTDPTFASLDLSAAGPTAAALTAVDATAGTYPQSTLISRTGYSSLTDTLVNFYGLYDYWGDHNWPSDGYYPGAYKIFKGNYLLAGDGDQYTAANSPYKNVYVGYHSGGMHSNYMEIGGATNTIPVGLPCGAIMPRANTDGSSNRFAYAMVDSTACYQSPVGATRVQRHLIDFKKASTQQFIVVYDDVVTAAGQTKRAYLHYPNNFGQSGITDTSRGSTTVSGSTVTSSNPGTGNSDATQLLTTFLAPGANQVYVYTNNADGSYTGGLGKTYRVSACASSNGTSCDATNTAAEFLTVQEPVLGSGNTMPATSIITSDANWRALQVAGSSPKVVLFAIGGVTYSSATLTSTHTGTAQYALAGLTAGTYAVSGPVTLTNQVVGTDGILYWEGGSGAYTITAGYVSVSITTTTLPAGKALTAYSQTLGVTGGIGPYTWSSPVPVGLLCPGLSLNASTGVLSGTPVLPAVCSFIAQVSDSNAGSASQPLSITIADVARTALTGAAGLTGGAAIR